MDLGGPRRRRSTPTRAGTPRSCWPRPSAQRQASASEIRRQNLVRKELAWLRRGAAGPDLEAEVPHRRRQRADRGRAAAARPARAAEVRRPSGSARTSSTSRTSTWSRGERTLLTHATWRLGPGDRVGIVGVNGAGKTSVLVAALRRPRARRPARSSTAARSRCSTSPSSSTTSTPTAGCCRSVESIRRVTKTADGGDHRDLDAGALRLHRRPAHRPDRRPVRWRAAPLPAAAAAARPSPTCCCSTSPPTTSTSTPSTCSRTSSTAGPARWSWSRTTATSSSGSPTRSGRCSATARSRCCRAASTSTSSAVPPASTCAAASTRRHRLRSGRARRPREGQGRQRRGAGGPQGGRPDRQAAASGSPSRRPAQRRDRRAHHRLRAARRARPQLRGAGRREGRRSSSSGSRPPSCWSSRSPRLHLKVTRQSIAGSGCAPTFGDVTITPQRRSLLPMLNLTHGKRSAVTCHLRCGDACSRPVPNTTDNGYFRDIAATALSRRGVLGGAGAADPDASPPPPRSVRRPPRPARAAAAVSRSPRSRRS